MDEFRGSLKGIKHFRTAVAPETIQANAQLLHASNNEVGWRAAGHIILGGGTEGIMGGTPKAEWSVGGLDFFCSSISGSRRQVFWTRIA